MARKRGAASRSRPRWGRGVSTGRGAMTTASAMPEIPGMWYDATRNRYFRITREHPPPSSPPLATPKPLASPSMHRILHTAETGLDIVTTRGLPLGLLAAATPRPVSLSHIRMPPSASDNVAGAIPHVTNPDSVVLCGFPDGRCLDAVDFSDYELLAVNWHEHRRGLSVAARSRNAAEYKLLFSLFGILEDPAPPLVLVTALPELPYCIAQGETPGFSVAGETGTFIQCSLNLNTPRQHRLRTRLKHRDASAGLATAFPSWPHVFTGTRAGNLYRWDLRQGPTRLAWTGRPSKANCSVAGLKLGGDGHTLYVSCMKNQQNNLAAWDLRMFRDGRDPLLQFAEHVNSHKRLSIDLDESSSGGVLIAGGDDGCVRVWNAKTGGRAVGCKAFPGELPVNVKLVRWESCPAGGRPGAWIVTNRKAYVMEIGGHST